MLTLDDDTKAAIVAALSVEYSFEELEQLGDLFRREHTRRVEVQAEIAGLTERVDWDELGAVMTLARREYHREYYQWRAAFHPRRHAEALGKRNVKRRTDYAALPEDERETARARKRERDRACYHAQPEAVRKAAKREEHRRARSDPEKLARIREQQRAAQARHRAARAKRGGTT